MGRNVQADIEWMDGVYGALPKPKWSACSWTGNRVWKVILLDSKSGQIRVSHEFYPEDRHRLVYGFSLVHGLVHDWITTEGDASKWEPQCYIDIDDEDPCPVCPGITRSIDT